MKELSFCFPMIAAFSHHERWSWSIKPRQENPCRQKIPHIMKLLSAAVDLSRESYLKKKKQFLVRCFYIRPRQHLFYVISGSMTNHFGCSQSPFIQLWSIRVLRCQMKWDSICVIINILKSYVSAHIVASHSFIHLLLDKVPLIIMYFVCELYIHFKQRSFKTELILLVAFPSQCSALC